MPLDAWRSTLTTAQVPRRTLPPLSLFSRHPADLRHLRHLSLKLLDLNSYVRRCLNLAILPSTFSPLPQLADSLSMDDFPSLSNAALPSPFLPFAQSAATSISRGLSGHGPVHESSDASVPSHARDTFPKLAKRFAYLRQCLSKWLVIFAAMSQCLQKSTQLLQLQLHLLHPLLQRKRRLVTAPAMHFICRSLNPVLRRSSSSTALDAFFT